MKEAELLREIIKKLREHTNSKSLKQLRIITYGLDKEHNINGGLNEN